MTFSIPAFAAFAFLGAILLRLVPPRAFFSVANIVSIFFVWSFFGTFALATLMLIIVVGFGLVRLGERFGRRAILPGIVFVVSMFLIVKRYPFVPQIDALSSAGTVVGVSFIVFRLVHLIVDAAEQSIEPVRFAPFVFFNLFFLTLLSGPIARFEQFEAGLVRKPLQLSDLLRLVWGLFKITVIAPPLLQLNALLVGKAAELSGGAAVAAFPTPAMSTSELLAFNAETAAAGAFWFVYLYFNFGGYMDVVLGAGRIAGIDLPENFDHPFRANSFLQFWNRWHMTLSFWFRTYIFSPLFKTLYKKFPSAGAVMAQVSLFATFLLVGAWHGTTWSFVVCGLVLACGAVANDAFQHACNSVLGKKRMRALNARFIYQCLCFGLTFTFLAIAFIPFWMPEGEYFHFVRYFASITGLAVFLGMWVAATFCIAVIRASESSGVGAVQSCVDGIQRRFGALNVQATGLAIAMNVIVLVQLVNVGQVQSFVYQTY